MTGRKRSAGGTGPAGAPGGQAPAADVPTVDALPTGVPTTGAWMADGRGVRTARDQPSITDARTHRTSGRCEASCCQLSPSSALAYSSPLRLPK